MLFTNFLKNHSKGKENSRAEHNSEEEVSKPQETGVISNIKQGLTSSAIQDSEVLIQNQLSSGSGICQTMSKMRVCTEIMEQSTEKSENPLHRIGLRKSQARQRSRNSRVKLKTSSECSDLKVDFPINDILQQPHKLCINCDKFIPSSCILSHEKQCQGFERLLQMTKQDLFMFVHNKIASCQVKLDQVKMNTKRGTVIGNPLAIVTDLECRINHLHKVRNAIMVKLR